MFLTFGLFEVSVCSYNDCHILIKKLIVSSLEINIVSISYDYINQNMNYFETSTIYPFPTFSIINYYYFLIKPIYLLLCSTL